jgi:hypothetical protein
MYNFIYIYFLAVLELELWASLLSHSASLFVLGIFKIGSHKLFAEPALNLNPPDVCFTSN